MDLNEAKKIILENEELDYNKIFRYDTKLIELKKHLSTKFNLLIDVLNENKNKDSIKKVKVKNEYFILYLSSFKRTSVREIYNSYNSILSYNRLGLWKIEYKIGFIDIDYCIDVISSYAENIKNPYFVYCLKDKLVIGNNNLTRSKQKDNIISNHKSLIDAEEKIRFLLLEKDKNEKINK